MATIESRKRQIENTFKDYSVILDPSIRRVEIQSTSGKNESIIYVPYRVSLDDPKNGLPLKDGVGFLSIREEIDKEGKVSGYLYRFTSDEYTYLAEKKNDGSLCFDGFFNFHYQKDSRHEITHVSFLHPSIQYISRSICLNDFLDFVKRVFFIDNTRKYSLPWHSRF